jgi:hypothetical protein
MALRIPGGTPVLGDFNLDDKLDAVDVGQSSNSATLYVGGARGGATGAAAACEYLVSGYKAYRELLSPRPNRPQLDRITVAWLTGPRRIWD